MKARIFHIANQMGKDVAKSYIDKLPDGKRYDVVVKMHREKRTISQNSLFHKWCLCIEEDTGTDRQVVKNYLKEQFLGYKEIEVFGHKSYELTHTSSLSKEQMMVFMNKVQAWAAQEQGIILPNKDDLYFAQFIEEFND